MRKVLLPVLLAALVSAAGVARADGPPAVIEKAIKAHGGEEKLAGLAAVTAKSRGTLSAGAGIPFTLETVWQAPDRIKNIVTLGEGGQKLTVIEAAAGEAGWASANGKAGPLAPEKLDELRAQAHVRRLLGLVPLLRGSTCEVSGLDEVKIDDRAAVGVRVACPGERDVKLYFDAETGLLAKVERRIFDDVAKKVVVQEEFYRDYRDVEGLPTAMKQVWHRDGKKALEMTFTDIHYPKKIDLDVFADPRPFTRARDVVYGHKNGVALTLDVFTPKKAANGAAVVVVMSGGWVSDRASIDEPFFGAFLDEPLKRGYTVFAVCHGSQPRFTVPDAVADVNRAVRFVRYHARRYRIDPKRIGIAGGSAGGHLSLMQGTAGDRGDPKAIDPIDRTSSRVQAVACFFPPTDFLNYGEAGKNAFDENGTLANFRTAVDVRELDPRTKRLEHITDKEKFQAMCRRISPITHVSSDDPPTLIIHGDADKLVPIQQAEVILARFKEVGVPAELVVKKGAAHGWGGMDKDVVTLIDWFDKYLAKK
jgi:acetyl esterase/lipase